VFELAVEGAAAINLRLFRVVGKVIKFGIFEAA
jgi:hypothetical protein